MTAVEIHAPADGRLAFTDEHVQMMSDVIAPGASPAEIEVFLHVCAHVQLDPLRNQIWLVPRYDSSLKRRVYKPQTGIDGMRLIAQRTALYGGQFDPEWCGPDGVWRDVWLSKDNPTAARVRVARKDWSEPAVGVAKWDEFAVFNKVDGKMKLGAMWAQMPSLMLAKCAEAQALRKAFPAEMAGVYADVEVAADEGPQRVDIIEASPDVETVKGIFDRFMPLVPRLGDVDRFKAHVKALAAERGLGDIGSFAASALTLEQAELMLAEAQRIADSEPADADPQVYVEGRSSVEVTRDVLVEFAEANGVTLTTSKPTKPDLVEAITEHLGAASPAEAIAHINDWNQQ